MKWTRDSGKEPPKSPAVKRVEEDARKHGPRLPPGQVLIEDALSRLISRDDFIASLIVR